uniref:Uncharacterized protein n=1 Tax=Setaria italica TaxID=4555 RepID=K3XM10_SETIT
MMTDKVTSELLQSELRYALARGGDPEPHRQNGAYVRVTCTYMPDDIRPAVVSTKTCWRPCLCHNHTWYAREQHHMGAVYIFSSSICWAPAPCAGRVSAGQRFRGRRRGTSAGHRLIRRASSAGERARAEGASTEPESRVCVVTATHGRDSVEGDRNDKCPGREERDRILYSAEREVNVHARFRYSPIDQAKANFGMRCSNTVAFRLYL